MPLNLQPSPDVQQQILSQMKPATTQTAPNPNYSPKWPMASLAIGQGLDNLTTNLGKSGGNEMNPLLPRAGWGNAAMQGATTAGLLYALHKYGPTHPTMAKILGYGLGGFGGLNTANNLSGGKIYGTH